MTEYWKSVPKKFCEVCKCWFYDNKASIQHHEQGLKHQNNVQEKLRQLGKKGRQQEAAAREARNALMQMEMGALKAYKKDIKDNAAAASAYNIHMNVAGLPLTGNKPSQPTSAVSAASISKVVWYEGKSPEGYTYFYNVDTKASQWEAPHGVSYVSLAEQESYAAATGDYTYQEATGNFEQPAEEQPSTSEPTVKEEPKEEPEEEIEKETDDAPSTAPEKTKRTKFTAKIKFSSVKVKAEPTDDEIKDTVEESPTEPASVPVEEPILAPAYGAWQPVEEPSDRLKKGEFDYLPHNKNQKLEDTESQYQVIDEEPDETIEFTERKVPTNNVGSTANTSFKKRKIAGGSRNIRGRDS